MLLIAEKIMYQNDRYGISENELYEIIKKELAEKLVEEMMKENLIKIMIQTDKLNAALGTVETRIRATVRAYNPDD